MKGVDKIVNNILGKDDIIECNWCMGEGVDENNHTCKKCNGMGSYCR